MNRIIKFLLIFVFPTSLFAHDFWIEKKQEGFVLYYGHKGHGHGGEKFIEYKPADVQDIQCFDDKGNRLKISPEKRYPLIIKERCSAVFVLFSSGYWTKTPYGTKNVPKNEESAVVSSWLSYENVKRLEKWKEELAKPLTDNLELTPLNDPFKLKSGNKLNLLVTYKGKPLKDVVVVCDDKPRGTTDDNGKIRLAIKHGGLQVIQATYKEKSDGIKADEIIYTTNLNFELED